QPAGDGEAADIRPDIGVGLDGHVERGRGIIDSAADERLHRRVAAAGVDELDFEAVPPEQTARARDLVGHAAEELAAIGELDALGLCRRGDWYRARDQRGALEQGAARHVGVGHARGALVATTHGGGNLLSDLRSSIPIIFSVQAPSAGVFFQVSTRGSGNLPFVYRNVANKGSPSQVRWSGRVAASSQARVSASRSGASVAATRA